MNKNNNDNENENKNKQKNENNNEQKKKYRPKDYDELRLDEFDEDARNVSMQYSGMAVLILLLGVLTLFNVMNQLVAVGFFMVAGIFIWYLYQMFLNKISDFLYYDIYEVQHFEEKDYDCTDFDKETKKEIQDKIKTIKKNNKKIRKNIKVIVDSYFKQVYDFRNNLLWTCLFYFIVFLGTYFF